jgi:hypothetical protein
LTLIQTLSGPLALLNIIYPAQPFQIFSALLPSNVAAVLSGIYPQFSNMVVLLSILLMLIPLVWLFHLFIKGTEERQFKNGQYL